MDQEVSKTLGELERKLQELERTLTSIDRGERIGEEAPVSAEHSPADRRRPAPLPPPPADLRSADWSTKRLSRPRASSEHHVRTPSSPRESHSPRNHHNLSNHRGLREAKTPSADQLLRFRDRLERTRERADPGI